MPNEIRFDSIHPLLEFYYGFHASGYRGIDCSIARVDRSVQIDTRQLDAFSTIGFYIHRLDAVKKCVLAYFYLQRMNDDITARMISVHFKKSYKAYLVKIIRRSAINELRDTFRIIGMIHGD